MMAFLESNVAVVALVVALCALIVSLGQLLGQYFATADGYRRCQPSVMGPWAKRTRLRWRWREFRLETMFTTPRILLTPLPNDRSSIPFNNGDNQRNVVKESTSENDMEHVTGSPESLYRTMAVTLDGEYRSNELACWVHFLGSLHRNEWELKKYIPDLNRQGQLVGPAVRFHEMSWDFMPPEIVRPFAVTTVCDIAIMAHRLGMVWEVFDPETGIMRAEGNGHGLSSTFARGIGPILQYVHTKGAGTTFERTAPYFANVKLSNTELYIPTREADMMGFGILPGCDRLKLPSFKIGTHSDVINTMNSLDSTHKASLKLQQIRELLKDKWDAHCTYGFSDIIPLACPMIRRKGSTVTRVPIPAEHYSGILSMEAGFITFRNRLSAYLSNTTSGLAQARWVLQQYERLAQRYPDWQIEAPATQKHSLDFLEDVHACSDACSQYLAGLQSAHNLSYRDLMAAHLTQSVNYWGDAWTALKSGTARESYGQSRTLEVEGMHIYSDYLPRMVDGLRKRGFKGAEETVHEAWFVLIFRAFCWWRCHDLYPGEKQSYKGSPLPSRYWGSQLPVYIG